MTEEMLSLARANAARAGAANVEFLSGHIDVIISNCVINLSGDKAAVFAEAGFTAISISPTHEVATGLHSAIIGAVKA